MRRVCVTPALSLVSLREPALKLVVYYFRKNINKTNLKMIEIREIGDSFSADATTKLLGRVVFLTS